MTETRDWRSYVELSPDFTPAERSQIERSLDFVANARDDEGLQLLQAGYRNNGDQPITIAPTRDGQGSFASAYSGIVGIDFDQARRIQVNEGGTERPLSLNGILVHELYHIAQTPISYDTVSDQVRETIRERAVANGWGDNLRQHPQLLDNAVREAMPLVDSDFEGGIRERLRPGETSGQLPEVYGGSVGLLRAMVPDYNEQLENIARNADPHRHQDVGGTPHIEQEATRFTDAFMEKNVGTAEPARVEYGNANLAATARAETVVLPSTGREFESEGYRGTTASAHITPSDGIDTRMPAQEPPSEMVPPLAAATRTPTASGEPSRDPRDLAAALEGINLAGLNLGSTDGIHRSRGETARLASQSFGQDQNTGQSMVASV